MSKRIRIIGISGKPRTIVDIHEFKATIIIRVRHLINILDDMRKRGAEEFDIEIFEPDEALNKFRK